MATFSTGIDTKSFQVSLLLSTFIYDMHIFYFLASLGSKEVLNWYTCDHVFWFLNVKMTI